MDYRNRPTAPRELLHWYALFNLKHSRWPAAKCYPSDTQILETLPDFPHIAGFKLTQSLSDYGQPDLGSDWVIQYDV